MAGFPNGSQHSNPDRHQNLNAYSSYTTTNPAVKFHPNPLIIFLVMLVLERQADRQTDKQRNTTNT